ncbi:MAG: hypothetical protein GKR93_08610 [Gammaproteobacteria bacterium]|nr:hypothetical protein [Gammaproteobacteria bacterium]
MIESGVRSWYREPYVWLLISFPLAAVVGGIFTIILAIQSDDGLVVDDYYKNGLAINRTLKRDEVARRHNLSSIIQLESGASHFRIILEADKDFQFPTTLQGHFMNASRDGFDQIIELSQQEKSIYQGLNPDLVRGKWHLLIEAGNWRLLRTLTVP